MDMDVGDDLILGWDWISSHYLRHLFVAGQVSLLSGPVAYNITQYYLDITILLNITYNIGYSRVFNSILLNITFNITQLNIVMSI